jgi:hypothetical protein
MWLAFLVSKWPRRMVLIEARRVDVARLWRLLSKRLKWNIVSKPSKLAMGVRRRTIFMFLVLFLARCADGPGEGHE